VHSVVDRAQYAIHWQKEYESVDALIRDHGPDVVGRRGFQEHRLVGDFRRWVAEILEAVVDRLQPRNFDDLAKYGLDDLGIASVERNGGAASANRQELVR
jgi:hypothetical protein